MIKITATAVTKKVVCGVKKYQTTPAKELASKVVTLLSAS